MKKSLLILFFFSYGVQFFSQTSFTVAFKNDKSGIKYNDTWKVRPVYDQIIQVSSYCYILKKNNKYGLYRFNYNHYMLVPAKYDSLQYNGNNIFALADKTGLYAIFNHSGEQITQFAV